MELECNLNKGRNSYPLIMKLQSYKNDFDITKRKFNKLQESYNERKNNALLLGDNDGNDNGLHKQKLIENEELAWKQGEKLEGAKRSVIEMEGISHGIMRDLDHHTGKIRIITGGLGEMGGELEQSNSIMGRILKRENRNKVIIGVFSVIVILAFILIIYFKLAPAGSTTETPAVIPTPSPPTNSTNSTP